MMSRPLMDAFVTLLLLAACPWLPIEGATTPSAQSVIDLQAGPSDGPLCSPGFPNNYPNNVNRTWRIEAPRSGVVQLVFDKFDLEKSKLTPDCSWDYVAVYDNTDGLIGTFCGKRLPPRIESTSNVLLVVFVSDASVSKSGFSAKYYAVRKVEPAAAGKEDVAGSTFHVPEEFFYYCKDLGYSSSTIPNFFGHRSDIEIVTSQQWQDMKTANDSCHPHIQPFLCTLLMPSSVERKEQPCRSWCKEVQSSCPTSVINGSSFEAFDCELFPAIDCINLDPPEDCYFGRGENYKGMGVLPEEGGKTCQNWTDVLGPMAAYYDWADPQENYCRNLIPEASPEPFCVVKSRIDGREYGLPEPCGLKPCNEIGCGLPPRVESGSRSPIQNFYRVGEKVFISCNVGYIMEEENAWVTCKKDGTWSKRYVRCKVDHRMQLASMLLSSERYSPQLAPSRNKVTVIFEAAMVEIIDADEKNENMFASVAFRLRWRDNRLSWTPTKYGRVSELVVTTKDVWIPKVYLKRNGDAKFSGFPDAPVTVSNDGQVEWDIIDLLTTTCDLEPALFPFDSMECPVCLGASTRVERFVCPERRNEWMAESYRSHIEHFMNCGDVGVDVADQWKARWTVTVNTSVFGSGCINVKFDRIPTFHFCTTLSPAIILSILMCITFVLPIEKGDRLSFGMTILLSMVVSLVFITEVLPAKGSMPVVALLIIVYMYMMAAFLIVTVIVIRISSREKQLPPFVRKVFLRYLARAVFLGDLTKPNQGHTVLEVDDFEMVKGTDNSNSKSSEAQPQQLLGVLLSLKDSVNDLSSAVESFATSGPQRNIEASEEEALKTDYQQLARVLDRFCLILYILGLILAIPIVRYSSGGDN